MVSALSSVQGFQGFGAAGAQWIGMLPPAKRVAARLQVQVCDDADIATWMTSLSEDPSMAALLEPIVAQDSSPPGVVRPCPGPGTGQRRVTALTRSLIDRCLGPRHLSLAAGGCCVIVAGLQTPPGHLQYAGFSKCAGYAGRQSSKTG